MGSTWKVLLLLGLATAVIARPRKTLTFKDASVLAAHKFNKNLNEGSKYRIVESSVSTPLEKECTPNFASLTCFGLRSVECNDIGSNNNQDVHSKRSTSDGIINTSPVPPGIRHIYEQAKYDIISRILCNF